LLEKSCIGALQTEGISIICPVEKVVHGFASAFTTSRIQIRSIVEMVAFMRTMVEEFSVFWPFIPELMPIERVV
jgi:hypothetical protein